MLHSAVAPFAKEIPKRRCTPGKGGGVRANLCGRPELSDTVTRFGSVGLKNAHTKQERGFSEINGQEAAGPGLELEGGCGDWHYEPRAGPTGLQISILGPPAAAGSRR